MNHIHVILQLTLILDFVAGVVIGSLYFGGLWLTIRRLPTARRPALLFLGSYFGRNAACLIGFFAVMQGRWERLLACLAGFLLARFVAVRIRLPEQRPVGPA